MTDRPFDYPPKALIAWSSGKDSAWALHCVQTQALARPVALLTTMHASPRRVSVHSVREELLDAQAESIGLPLIKVWIPHPCSNRDYEIAMNNALGQAKEQGITKIVFGDLYLEDVRHYRERQLVETGIQPLFPLWGLNTKALAKTMIEAGLQAYLTCIDSRQLSAEFAGRLFDQSLLEELPQQVDPCGERGEFHTFAFDGPMFRTPVPATPGTLESRDGFIFADLLPASAERDHPIS